MVRLVGRATATSLSPLLNLSLAPARRDGGALLLRRYRHLFPHEQQAAAAAFERLVVCGGVAQGLQPAVSDQRGH